MTNWITGLWKGTYTLKLPIAVRAPRVISVDANLTNLFLRDAIFKLAVSRAWWMPFVLAVEVRTLDNHPEI